MTPMLEVIAYTFVAAVFIYIAAIGVIVFRCWK